MKLSNEKLLSDIPVLRNISQKELPVKVSYAIAKNLNKIEFELKVYENERTKLIDKYALKDDKGQVKVDDSGQIIFKDGCKEQWNKDIKELLAIENEVEIHKFNIALLEGHIMSASDIMCIDYMIEE